MLIGREWPSAIAWCSCDDEIVRRNCDPSVLKGEEEGEELTGLATFLFTLRQASVTYCVQVCMCVYAFLLALCKVQVTYRLQESR